MILPPPPISHVSFYVRDLDRVASFHEEHFGFRRKGEAAGKRILFPADGGWRLVPLQASRGHRAGHSIVKLSFDVPTVRDYREALLRAGVKFGIIHRRAGSQFSNARDQAENLIQSSNSHRCDAGGD